MSYHWNWGILLSPVSTGEPTTYLGWLLSGFWVTITRVAVGMGDRADRRLVVRCAAHGAEQIGRPASARSTSRFSAIFR